MDDGSSLVGSVLGRTDERNDWLERKVKEFRRESEYLGMGMSTWVTAFGPKK